MSSEFSHTVYTDTHIPNLYSRRLFLKHVGLGATGFLLPKIHTQEPKSPQNPIQSRKYLDTIGGTISLTAIQSVINRFLLSKGINIGSSSEQYNPVSSRMHSSGDSSLRNMLLLAPLREEYLFRELPSILLKLPNQGMRWDIGLPTSAIFAAVHNFYNDNEGHIRFSRQSLPLLQFASGMYFWKRNREAGLTHAVLAHSLTNAYWLAIDR